MGGFIQSIIKNLHLLIYTFFIFRFINHKGVSNGALKLYQWRKRLSYAFLGYCLSFASYYILVWTSLIELQYDYLISVASTFFIYFIGYNGFQHQEVFKQYEIGRYEKSRLSASSSKAILDAMLALMNEKRVYLDSSLRLKDLSDQLGFPQHYVSQVINDINGKNFADFINEYRVEEAKKLLIQSDQRIIHVAYDSGFNNKASFNNAFKRFTGMSATEYRERQAALA